MAGLVLLALLMAVVLIAGAPCSIAQELASAHVEYNKPKMDEITLPAAPPCQEVCTEACATATEQHCTMVPVTRTECKDVKTTEVARSCTKKCTLGIITQDPTPEQTPATAAAAANVSTVAAPSSSSSSSANMATVNGRRMLKAREVDLLPLLADTESALKLEVHAHEAQLVCEDVCTDVPVEKTKQECWKVTSMAEACTHSPKTHCDKTCKCVTKSKITGLFTHSLLGKRLSLL